MFLIFSMLNYSKYSFLLPLFFFFYYVLFWPCLTTFSALFTVHLFIIHNPTYTWFSHGYSSCVVSCFVYSFPAATYQYKRLFFLLDSYLGYLQVILICISNFVQKGNFIQEKLYCHLREIHDLKSTFDSSTLKSLFIKLFCLIFLLDDRRYFYYFLALVV